MFGQSPAYNETTRKVIIAFGSIFNNICIKRPDDTGASTRLFRVPLSYADADKVFKTINKQMSQDESKVGQILPRMAFWIDSIEADSERMTQKNLRYRMVKDDRDVWVRRSPWKINIQLMVVGRYEEDVLKVIEQIYPIFQPSVSLTIKPIDGVEYSEDFNLRLMGVSPVREQENLDITRFITYTLSFTLPVWYYTGLTDSRIIETAIVEYNVEIPINETPTYEIAYTEDSVTGTYSDENVTGQILPSTLDSGIMANSGRVLIQRQAGQNIGIYRAVMETNQGKLLYPNLDSSTDGIGVVGISVKNIPEDQFGHVIVFGEIENPLWNFNLGPVYVGENGSIVQTPPVNKPWITRLGNAISPTRIMVDVRTTQLTEMVEQATLNGGFF